MPIYKYRCGICDAFIDMLKVMAKRGELPICPECIKPMPREFEAPFTQIGRAGSTIDRDDKFWKNADNNHHKKRNKRIENHGEKLQYDDKEQLAKEEAKIKNYEQTGNKESANEVIKTLEKKK